MQKVYEQIQPELTFFMKAQDEINQQARIDYNIYYASQTEYSTGLKGVHSAVVLSLSSPFKPQRGFTKQEVVDMFNQTLTESIAAVQEPSVLECINDKDEILFIFDAMLVDVALMKHHIHGEEFKSLIQKYSIIEDPVCKANLESVVAKLHEINETF